MILIIFIVMYVLNMFFIVISQNYLSETFLFVIFQEIKNLGIIYGYY